MSFDLGARPRRPRRAALLAMVPAAIAVLAAAVAVGLGGLGGSGAHPTPLPRPAVAPSRPAAAGPGGRVDPLPVLRLPRPHGRSGFVPVGFPYGPAGAASAVWRWTPVLFGLDPDTVAAAARVWADPSYPAAAQRMAAAAVHARAALGLPPAGPAGAAYLVVTPRMVRVVVADPAAPVVDVLAQVSAGAVNGTTTSRTIVLDCYLRWTGTDYRLLDHPLSAGRAGHPPAPDSPAAVAAGYRDAAEQ